MQKYWENAQELVKVDNLKIYQHRVLNFVQFDNLKAQVELLREFLQYDNLKAKWNGIPAKTFVDFILLLKTTSVEVYEEGFTAEGTPKQFKQRFILLIQNASEYELYFFCSFFITFFFLLIGFLYCICCRRLKSSEMMGPDVMLPTTSKKFNKSKKNKGVKKD